MAKRARGGNRQHASTGAEIEDTGKARHPEVLGALRRAAKGDPIIPAAILRSWFRSQRRMTDRSRANFSERLAQPLQRQQAAARRGVMSGAESLRRLDLDTDPVRRGAATIVATMHHKTSDRDRL